MQSASGACYAPTAVERRGAFGAGEYGCRSDYIFGVAADLIFGISIIFYHFQKSHFLERTGNMDQTRQNKKKTQRESNQEKTRKLTLSAMFFALGIVLRSGLDRFRQSEKYCFRCTFRFCCVV